MKSPLLQPAAAAVFAFVLLAGCARSEDATVRPAETNEGYSGVEQVRAPEADPSEPALGEWRRGLQQERQALEFGPIGAAPAITIVCGDHGGFVLERPGALPQGTAPSLAVGVGTGPPRQLPLTTGTGATAVQSATIPAGDPLLQQLASAQGPISLRFGDGAPLALPPSPLIGQFRASCDSGPAAPHGGETDVQAPAADNVADSDGG